MARNVSAKDTSGPRFRIQRESGPLHSSNHQRPSSSALEKRPSHGAFRRTEQAYAFLDSMPTEEKYFSHFSNESSLIACSI